MPEQYKHTQVGYLTLAILGAALFLMVVLTVAVEFHWIPLVVLIVLAMGMGLFATLTVEIDEDALEMVFGPGPIRKRFPVKEVASCRVVKNPWYYGWGIRLTPHGWLYNVSGSFGVELQMKSGRKYRIGTDQPERLEAAIQRAIGWKQGDGA